MNVDGEVEDRYAAQYYVGMYHLTRYLQQDERLLPHLLGQYKPSSEMIDADFLGEDQTNEEMLTKIVETYTRLNIQERKGSLE